MYRSNKTDSILQMDLELFIRKTTSFSPLTDILLTGRVYGVTCTDCNQLIINSYKNIIIFPNAVLLIPNPPSYTAPKKSSLFLFQILKL